MVTDTVVIVFSMSYSISKVTIANVTIRCFRHLRMQARLSTENFYVRCV